MNGTAIIDQTVAVPNVRDDRFWDAMDAKDVFFNDDPTGELEMAQKVPAAFENAGYKVFTLRKAKTHPVWILIARPKSAHQFAENARFIAHIIDVFRSVGVRARRADVTVDRRGKTIIVSFLWPLAVRSWLFDEKSGWSPDPFA